MARPEETQEHCDICREIRKGCEAEIVAHKTGKLVKCTACGNKGLIRRNGTAVVCNRCPRGFRMKLWLRHEELSGSDVREFEVV